MIARYLAAVAALALSTLPASAQTAKSPAPAHAPTANRDVRCLMLSNMFAKTATAAQAKEAAGQARLFYLGRVSGKYTSAQLPSAMAAESKSIDPEHAGTDMNACLATVQAGAATIEAAGRKAEGAVGAGPTKP